ncbi:MAG: tannase/feruloyl esterase family alpha/beta hydrolase, partial [Phenylobacterium sp.]|nr:tannase/feruloyl esterase family alpha/beta hydrolase [Phenylobacterium sp.]
MKQGLKIRLLACGLVAGAAAVLYGSPSAAAGACSVAAIQAMAPAGTTITSADSTAAPVPHCKIDGYITTTNPGPNKVNFRLQLPDQGWTKRYYFIGMGGAAGYVPTDSQIPGGNPLVKGFAVAGTDTGHTGNILDWGFLGNPALAVDHVHRGAHVTAVATQQITRLYYKTPTFYRYFSGCSGGGRMATESIQRHPEDFDGVLLGAPGGRSSATMLAFINAAQQASREPGAWLSPAKLSMLDRKVTAACDELDGAKDGIIWDHTRCHYDFTKLKCTSGDGPECLTAPELKTLQSILAGPRSPKGQIKVGFPVSNIGVWSQFLGPTPPPWSDAATNENLMKASAGYVIGNSLAKIFYGDKFNSITDFDFNNQAQVDSWWAAAKRIDFGYPYSADLRGLQKTGHKVLMWNGVSDPCCIDTEMLQYNKDAAALVGGTAALRQFAQVYRVPGMGHCGSGTGPNDAVDQLLNELVNWVEKKEAPGPVVTHRGADRLQLLFADPKTKQVSGVLVPPSTGGSRDFLLCPEPLVSTFDRSKA